MTVRWLPEAKAERDALPAGERQALLNAADKLAVVGDQLGFPHSSAVKAAGATLRELRPRRGRCPWRAFYRRVGDELLIAAVGPEAEADPRGFTRAAAVAVERLATDQEAEHG